MLRRNFLSFLSVSPLSLFIKGENVGERIIDVPEGVVVRTQKTEKDGSVSIRYHKDGLPSSNENHPSHISLYRGNISCRWENGFGPNNIASMYFDNCQKSCCVRLGPIYGKRSGCDVEFSINSGLCGTTWFDHNIGWQVETKKMSVRQFEEYIGITLKQFHSFR